MKKLTLITVFAALATGTFAATKTWDGGSATTANWSDADNWDAALAAGDILNFAGAARNDNNNDTTAGTSYAGIVFDSAASAFTLGGNAITLGSNITFSADPTGGIIHTINLDMILNADRRITTMTHGNIFVGGVISGSYKLTKSGAGIATLSGNNGYAGGTLFDGGTLAVQHNNALGTGKLDIERRNWSPTFLLDADGLVVANDIVIGDTGEQKNVRLVRDDTQTAELSGNITINETTAGHFDVETGAGDTLIMSGTIDGTGGAGLEKGGDGTLVLSGFNTFSGGISYDAGILAVRHNNALGNGILTMKDNGLDPVLLLDADGLAVANDIVIDDLNTTKTIKLDRDGTQTGTLSGSITIAETTAGNFNVETGAGDTLTMSGEIDGTGGAGIDKTGDGKLVLSGANTYAGATTIEAGTLAINGNNNGAVGAVTVQNTATLGGTGTVGGAVTVQSGGKIAPGSSVGTLTVNSDVTFESGSTYTVEVTSGTTACDKLIVSGTLALGGATLNIGTLDGVGRTIAIATNGLSGTFAGLADGAAVQGTYGSPGTYYIHYEYGQNPKHITINQNQSPTSSGVDLRAYQAADGIYVEFVAYDVEEDGTIMLALMGASGEVVWSGSVNVTAGPRFFARFLVPGLELGGTYNFQVRDEVGKWWEANGVTVGTFDTEMTSAALAGMTISFDSLPEREYEIQWTAQLGGVWQAVDTVTAAGEHTSVVVAYPNPQDPSGFFRVQLK